MNAQLKEEAIKLRLEQKLGYASIAKLVPVSRSTLSGWLRNYPLSDERILELRTANLKNNEAKIESYIRSRRLKREEKFADNYKKHLVVFKKISKQSRFTSGLMLYLAEGSKKDDFHISIANTDASVIKFFMKWMKEFMGVPVSSFNAQLHLYPTMDIEKEVKFWRLMLGLNKSQFYKPQIRKLQKGSFTYKESFRHGTCQIYFSSSEKKRELMSAIKAFVDSFLK